MYKARVKLKSGLFTHMTFYSIDEIKEFKNKGHEILRLIKGA